MSAMYNFLFDRKSLVLVLCGLALGGGMLFFAGVLVGVYWSLPNGTTIQAAAPPRPAPLPAREIAPIAAPPPVAPDPPSPVAVTAEPVSPTSAIPTISAVSAALAAAEGRPAPATVSPSAIPTGPTIELPTGPAPEEIPGPIAGAGESIGLPKTAPLPPAPPAPPAPPVPPAPLASPAPSVPVAAATPVNPEVAAGEGRYTIQVGAFSQVENSEETVAELSRQGYAPYVVEVHGSRGVLHVVRVGRYPDRGSAARAASDLRRRARMEAIVQRTPGEGTERPATSG